MTTNTKTTTTTTTTTLNGATVTVDTSRTLTVYSVNYHGYTVVLNRCTNGYSRYYLYIDTDDTRTPVPYDEHLNNIAERLTALTLLNDPIDLNDLSARAVAIIDEYICDIDCYLTDELGGEAYTEGNYTHISGVYNTDIAGAMTDYATAHGVNLLLMTDGVTDYMGDDITVDDLRRLGERGNYSAVTDMGEYNCYYGYTYDGTDWVIDDSYRMTVEQVLSLNGDPYDIIMNRVIAYTDTGLSYSELVAISEYITANINRLDADDLTELSDAGFYNTGLAIDYANNCVDKRTADDIDPEVWAFIRYHLTDHDKQAYNDLLTHMRDTYSPVELVDTGIAQALELGELI